MNHKTPCVRIETYQPSIRIYIDGRGNGLYLTLDEGRALLHALADYYEKQVVPKKTSKR